MRYEYCNGRAGGNIKQPHGESFCGRKKLYEKMIKKKDDGISRRERKSI